MTAGVANWMPGHFVGPGHKNRPISRASGASSSWQVAQKRDAWPKVKTIEMTATALAMTPELAIVSRPSYHFVKKPLRSNDSSTTSARFQERGKHPV
jgi:hypothetical protein